MNGHVNLRVGITNARDVEKHGGSQMSQNNKKIDWINLLEKVGMFVYKKPEKALLLLIVIVVIGMIIKKVL